MSKIAVDVVLLPDEAMTERAIEANKALVDEFGSEIVLDKENCLPHISLAMGVIAEPDVGKIEEILRIVAEELPIGELQVVGIHTSVNARGETVSVFEVKKARELQRLHEQVMMKMMRYFGYDVSEDMVRGEEVAETTLAWIANYPDKASFENFFPHITIGYGEAKETGFPIAFGASRLALCHLGNHCTCRKVLASVELEGAS
jgi:2'-5' RNA ligase